MTSLALSYIVFREEHQVAARRFFIALGIFLIGIPFGFLISSLFAYSTPFAEALVFTLFLTAWLLFSSMWTRSARFVYWCMHIAVWLFCLSLIIVISAASNDNGSLFWIFIPLPIGLSTLLGAFYGKIIAIFSNVSILKRPYQQPSPPPYQQGYKGPEQPRAAYEEGGQQHSYPSYEQPQAQYPQGMIQQ